MRTDGLTYLLGVISKSNRIHIFLNCTWNIFLDNMVGQKTSLK